MGEIFLDDGDVRLYQGDVTDVLAEMPSGSVDCVVTSPPYWGLRDYGDEGQLGLETTPDLYVERIVAVFREIRRVLAPHGTCWVNLGDSYAQQSGRKDADEGRESEFKSRGEDRGYAKGSNFANYGGRVGEARSTVVGGLKPKDLVGIPWRVAFALQADGWWLRADIIWAKPNPMPESVTDRPTKAHEYLFLLTKAPRYYFDQEAVRESAEWARWGDQTVVKKQPGTASWIGNRSKDDLRAAAIERGRVQPGNTADLGDAQLAPKGMGRNVRSVWTIATQPYPEAHFATYPEELVRRCVLAGCPERVCRVCGKPSERIVERGESDYARMKDKGIDWRVMREQAEREGKGHDSNRAHIGGTRNEHGNAFSYTAAERTDLGWSDCGHNDWRPGTVLDPFIGSGTSCKVARDHGRHSIGIDLSADYLNLAARRLQQLSLLT